MFIVGCAHKEQPQAVPYEPDKITEMLKVAASDIQRSLDQLSQVKQSQAKKEEVESYALPDSPVLTENMSFKWAGPFDLAVQVLADKIGFEFNEVGKEKARDILVNVDVLNEPIFRIFEKLAWQSEGRSKLILDENKKMVQIVYN
ncbi:MAG: DotD/TraH family lipoprotein [Bacteroidota bacterium]